MRTPAEKYRSELRRHRDSVAVKRQTKIAKQHGMSTSQPHKWAKRHAMDCGTPNCPLCGNRRHSRATKTNEKLTKQEQSFYQDVDATRERHSNGLLPDTDTPKEQE